MSPEVFAVAVQPDYRLLLTGANGKERMFDATPYLGRGVFTQLRDRRTFAQARVVAGSVG